MRDCAARSSGVRSAIAGATSARISPVSVDGTASGSSPVTESSDEARNRIVR